jgi:PKD repeat protein
VNFTDTSTNSPTSWSWTFGDGGTSTSQNPSHQYASANSYTVSLQATNAGGSDTETKTNYITVTVAPPVANFSGSPTSGNAPLTVNFTDSSTNTPTSWSWNFGDGGTSTAQNPSHQYTSANSYTVSLQATNAGGSDTETKTNYITVTSGGGAQDYFCNSVSVGIGSIVSGDHTSVHSSDNVYLVVHSATAGSKQATQQTHVFNTGLSSLSALSVTLEGKVTVASEPVHIYLYNYSSSSWTNVKSDHFGTSDITLNVDVSSPGNYISSGTVQVRIVTGYVHTVAYNLSTDLLKITATP